MRRSIANQERLSTRRPRAASLLAGATIVLLFMFIGLLTVQRASAASWEVVKTFAPLVIPEPNPPTWSEDVQLGGAGGIAINFDGTGGAAPGTVYTIGGQSTEPWHVARYSPEGDFELAWAVGGRCGPAAVPPSTCPAYPTGEGSGRGIAINQTTGNVYVFSGTRSKTVTEYLPDGSGPIAEFGERDTSGTATTSPDKVHGTNLKANIAVDASGDVYVYDAAESSNQFQRLMKFAPCVPGIFTSYCYVAGADIGGAFPPANGPSRPMVDSAGNVYVSGETFISEFDPAKPGNPVCTLNYGAGGITATALNPATGAQFFYAVKPKPEIHQLSPCNAQGKFVESGPSFPAKPPRGQIEGMGFNPKAEFPVKSPEREPGILYAAAAQECPLIGVCPKEAQGQSSLGYIFAPQIRKGPIVASESVDDIRSSSATLSAQITPNGSQASYIFQYITNAAFEANGPSQPFAGASEAPIGGAVLGTGQQPLLASAVVSGLAPGTDYRYRVKATNEDDTAFGAAERFRTFPLSAEGLPDNRAYELVSPSQKNGGEVLPLEPIKASCGNECKPGQAARRYPTQVGPLGDSLAYQAQPFTLNEGPAEYDEYVAKRAPAGWETTSMSPPLAGAPPRGSNFQAYALDPALTRGLVYATNQALTPGAPAGYRNLFGEQVGNRFALAPILQAAPPNRPEFGGEAFTMRYVGASADLSRVFFEANDALTDKTGLAPAAVDGGASKNNLYEWRSGQISLVNVQPLNNSSIPGASFGSGFLLADPSAPTADTSNAIAGDGSVVFWSSEAGQVYVRENGEQTREIPDHAGKFLTASKDGTKVLLSDGVLYDLQSNVTTNLTNGSGGFQGIVGQSDDLSSIYFVATTVLTATPNGIGAVAQAGEDNLYAWRGGALRFVGTLLLTDLGKFGLWSATPVQRAAESSPNGRWLAFNSKASLTGANTVGACGPFDLVEKKWVGSVPCEEVYLYDSEDGSLRCVSCNPTGGSPVGGSFLTVVHSANRNGESLSQPQFLTDSGRLYFDSRDQLSGRDTNGQVEDVYQYEPAGIGSCGIPEGCVSLISTGQGSGDANFLDTDSSGQNVFFTTRQQLVPRDRDELIDLYDARVNGGVAEDYEVPATECLGEGCQPASPPPPVESTAASAGVNGSGNVKPNGAKKHHQKKHKRKHHKSKKQGRKSAKAKKATNDKNREATK